MSVVCLNGELVDPAAAAVPADDPLARAGDGLIETMRARDGAVRARTRHMARLAGSVAALGYAALDMALVERDLDRVLAAAGPGDLRVRTCVSPSGLRWTEAVPTSALSPAPRLVTAMTVPGGWVPSWWPAQHKTASRAHHAHSARLVRAAGMDTALLLDGAGRMGEALHASVFVVSDGETLTAPVRGILPGVGRALVRELMPEVVERAADREAWQRASEVFVVSALAGVGAVVAIDDAEVGGGTPGPVTRRAAGLFAAHSPG